MNATPCPDCGHTAVHGALAGCTATVADGGWCPCTRPTLPAARTPYDGGTSSGWSGSDASQQRAATRDADGSTHRIQSQVLEMAAATGGFGLTVAEARDVLDAHHGTVSGALSALHKAGDLARLVEKRNRCQVYVLPDYVDGRAVAPHGRKRPAPIALSAADRDTLRRVQIALDTTSTLPNGAARVVLLPETAADLSAILARLQ